MKEKYPLIRITWNDAYHLNDSWLSVKQIAEAYNVGWLLYEDKNYLIYGDFGFVMMIPKSIIRKREKLYP